MKTSVVLFDAGGVLFHANMVVGEALKERFGLSDEEQRAYWKGEYLKASRGQITTEQLLDWFADHYDIPRNQVTQEVFVKPFDDALIPMEGMDDLVKRVAATGVEMALLTDTSAMYADSRDTLETYRFFPKAFCSYQTGFLKPEPEAYQNVIRYYGVPPEEILFIDDNPKNIEGAQRQGMRGIVCIHTDQLEDALIKEGVL